MKTETVLNISILLVPLDAFQNEENYQHIRNGLNEIPNYSKNDIDWN